PETVCETYCVPGRTRRKLVRDYTCCFDPCTCQTVSKPNGWKWVTCKEADQTRTRQVTRHRTVVEQVPCTTYVRKTCVEKVPVTVCKKVPYTYTKKVPVTVVRTVRQNVVETVPVTTTRMVTEVVRKQVPYTTVRTVRGCYVDVGNGVTAGANGCGVCGPGVNVSALQGHESEAPGRVFVEGASCNTERMVT